MANLSQCTGQDSGILCVKNQHSVALKLGFDAEDYNSMKESWLWYQYYQLHSRYIPSLTQGMGYT